MGSVTINKKEYERLKADKARIEYLEKVAEVGRIRFLGQDFSFPIPTMSMRDIIDTYRLNHKL